MLVFQKKYSIFAKNKKMKSTFREWTLDKVDEAFGTTQVRSIGILEDLLSFKYEINDFERQYLTELRENYMFGGDDWNEYELENKFISPLIVFSKMDNIQFAYFLERPLSATIGEYELTGLVDGMIATGFRSPKKPYFCMKEYKRQTDPDGDPKGQSLIAMWVSQHLNDNGKPIFGCYIIGRHWYFMVLVEKQYAISKSFACDDDEVFDIYRILKSLRWHIEKLM